MARVESGGYQFIDSPVPPPPHRPSVSEELDTITSLPPSTPPHRKRGILRNPSSDSLHSHQSSSSSVSNVEHHKPGDRRDSKQVCFTCIPDIQPDCQADSSSDNHVGGDSTNGDRTNGASDELVNTTTGDASHTDAADMLNDRSSDGDSMMEEGFLLEEVGEGETRPYRPPRQVPPPLSKLKKLQSQLDFDQLAKNELELKANLYFHIGNPLKRWRVERVVPIKLILQVLKTVCLIVQVFLFTLTISHQRAKFFFESRGVFENLFLKNFDPEHPRTSYTAYTIPDVLDEIDYIATRYHKLPDITIGGFDYLRDESGSIAPIQMHLRQFSEAKLNASTFSYILDGSISERSFSINNSLSERNASTQFLEQANDPLFHRFLDVEISIFVKNIRIVGPALAECFLFHIPIVFRKDEGSGKVFYDLRLKSEKESCNAVINTPANVDNLPLQTGFLTLLDAIVISLCCLSLFLTVNSLRRARKLGRAMGSFYHNQLKLPLSWWERRSLFSPFHLVNALSDVVILTGTLIKILLDYNVIIDSSATRVLLGTALLFQAAVILRYISYFNQLNALTRTLVIAVPLLLKFLLCAAILFIAFSLCGWIVLGPYHTKFGDPNSAIESLFCLLNGDDIYNTYIMLTISDDAVAYIYSRLFLYVFVALFTYAILNLFTSLVIAAYELSQNMDTATQNEVRRFVFSGPLTPHGVALRDVTITRKFVDPLVVKHKSVRKIQQDEDDCL